MGERNVQFAFAVDQAFLDCFLALAQFLIDEHRTDQFVDDRIGVEIFKFLSTIR